MPGPLLSANLKAALKGQAGVSAGWVFEADLVLTPGAAPTTVRFGTEDAASWGRGHFDGLIQDPGKGRRAVPFITGGDLHIPSTTITLIETDAKSPLGARFWGKLTHGPVARNVAGSPARIYLDSGALTTFNDAFLETNMVIFDWDSSVEKLVTLTLKPDEQLLERAIPDLAFTEALYPYADPDVWGLFAPLVYGIYDSAPTTRKGMLPAYYVDRVTAGAFRYFCAIGKITVTAVFVDGEPFTDYTVEYVERGGYDVTELVFATDQEDRSVTFDGMGYRDNDGDLIVNPASILAHFLTNFAFGNPTGTTWHNGPWLTACPMLNLASNSGFVSGVFGYFNTRNITGAGYLGAAEQRSPLAVLNEVSTGWLLQPYFLNSGKLDIAILDPGKRRPTNDDLYLMPDDVKRFVPKDENFMTRKVGVAYHFDPVASRYTKNVETSDPTVPGNKGLLPWSLSWGPVNEGDQLFAESPPV